MSYVFTDGEYKVYVKSDFGNNSGIASVYSKSNEITFNRMRNDYFHKQVFFYVNDGWGDYVTNGREILLGESAPVNAFEYPSGTNISRFKIAEQSEAGVITLNGTTVTANKPGLGVISDIKNRTLFYIYVPEPESSLPLRYEYMKGNDGAYYCDVGLNPVVPEELYLVCYMKNEIYDDLQSYEAISSNPNIIDVRFISTGQGYYGSYFTISLDIHNSGPITLTTRATTSNNSYSISAEIRPMTGLWFGMVEYYL